VRFYHIIKSSFGWKSRFGCTSPILRKIGGASRIAVLGRSSFCVREQFDADLPFKGEQRDGIRLKLGAETFDSYTQHPFVLYPMRTEIPQNIPG
jgi:hypothetical protein